MITKLHLLLESTESYFEIVPFIIYSHLNVSWKNQMSKASDKGK